MKLNNNQIDLLEQMVRDGYIKRTPHNNLGLYIYKYTEKCTYEEIWNEMTIMCRGLVLDSDYNIIMNCIPKFFNRNEKFAYKEYNMDYEVYEKKDGSLIQITRLFNGDILISSAGSLDINSPYIQLATKLMYKQGIDELIEYGKTYIFEMIAPLTRVVVNYGEEESLNLITIRDNETGKEFTSNDVRFKTIQPLDLNIDSIDLQSKFDNKEGCVIRFSNGNRIKMKYKEYLSLHKTLSHLNEKFIIECIRDGLDLEVVIKSTPDEYYDYIKTVEKNVNYVKNLLITMVNKNITFLKNSIYSRKEQAKFIMDNFKDYSSLMFSALDGKDIQKMIFEHILLLYNKYNENKTSHTVFESFILKELKYYL